MPFFLEIPEEHAHVWLTRVELPAPSFQQQKEYFLQYCREYIWIFEGVRSGANAEEKVNIIHPPNFLGYTWFYPKDVFEVEGPSRIISIKEFVTLYNQSRALRKLPHFQWDESVLTCIRDFDAYEAEGKGSS